MKRLTVRPDLISLPLTSNQKRLWIFAQQDKSNPAYNLQLTYHFRGEVDANVLNKSLTLLFERQHTMFSVFKQKDGNPYIEIIPGTVNVKFVDFSNLPIDTRKEKLLAFAGEDSRKCFDLESGPLYRLYLLKEHDESYYFHATIHHIIFDGWSRRVFVQELSKIYVSLIQEVKDDLEPLNFHSYDYAGIEEASFSAGEEAELISFWKDNLQDSPSELRLPFDHPRGAESTGLGRRESFEISEKSTFKLKEISKKEDTTLFNTVLSILGVLLQKYSGEDDICIGVPVSCRRFHPELDKIFGLFINTTVVRLKIDNNNKINDHLKKSKVAVRNAIKNSKLPFENIVEAVNPERISGVNPLFQVSLSWMTDMTIPMNFGNIKGERVTLPEGVSPFDVTLYMWEEGEIIKGDIEYNVDIFQRNTILRLKNSFIHLVDSIADCPEKNLSEISVISETEQQRINVFNHTEAPVPSCLIQDFFEKQSVLQPAKTAVISGNSSLTYKQMNEQANQLAGHLISLGVKSGDVAGICLERSAEMIVSVLGVLKAGCCYLPMDPSFPDDRIRYMYEDSGAKVLISQSSLKEKYSHFPGTDIVLIDSDWEKISRQSTDKSALHTDNQSLAYIIYTSGSTGKPKGVRVHHQSVVNLIESMSVKPGIKPDDILLAVVTLSFDMSVFELFVTLSKGATVVVATSQEVTDGSALINLIDKHNVSIIQATPSLWNILLSSGWKGKNNLKALCGGEALTYSLINQIIPKVGEFWNCYGPTETTVYSACTRITDANAPILIGKPINNTRIYILDKNNNQLPIGVTGEVCIGGLGVTKGYHNRPELTAEKFITFDNDQIIYKTGDLGRFLDDGNIELFGRADNQIKLRGFRIEPGEVEALLSMLKGVREAVVKIHRFEDNDDRLVVFINADGDFKMTKEEIIISLSKHLPAYMIPSFIQVSDGFPRLPNGKINKKALIYELQKADQKQELDFDSLSETQKKLLTIWASVLKTQSITINDNFFDTGGNSLLGIRLINKIKEEFDATMTFRDLIGNATIIQLSRFLDSQTGGPQETIKLVHLTETTHLPLTANQKRLWMISKMDPDIPSYIISYTYKLNGSLDRDIFQKSLEKLFHRHHIVFSVIKEIDGEPYCDILSREIDLLFFDYSGLSENDLSSKINGILEADSWKIFDLVNGPLYRLYLVKTATDEYYFHMSIHHIVFDGWSWSVLVNDLDAIYSNLLRGSEISLPRLDFQEYDYAQWEKKIEDSDRGNRSIAFWQNNLNGCSHVINFPYDFQRKEHPTSRGSHERIRLTRDLTDGIKRLSKLEGSSPFTTLLSAFGIQMHKYSGEDDINIGLWVANRPHTKLENIFGMFVNTVVARLRYSKEQTFKEILHQSNDVALNAITHQDLSFDKVVKIINPERTSNVNPLFQVVFAWQDNLGMPIKT